MSKKDGVIEDDFDFVIRQREIKNRDREKNQKNLKELLLSIKLFDKIDDDTVEKNEQRVRQSYYGYGDIAIRESIISVLTHLLNEYKLLNKRDRDRFIGSWEGQSIGELYERVIIIYKWMDNTPEKWSRL